ncbi:class I SAM-dependent methyltransferase [Actinophytocola sp.]|uniref:class I SAM-dependent methyltransferase n=1 Tax=Actinophytocola sp. TaxID=1872138 RepID=UPI00389A1234
MDQQFWEDLYRAKDQLWSGAPNGALVAEVAELPPGQALDLGCGEGADALWLAGRGWLVTAVDLSRVALERAAAAAGDAKVSWTHADLTTYTPPAGAFDLVVAMYGAIPHTAEQAVQRMLAAVAPGGTLLVGGHDLTHMHEHQSPLDPKDYYTPGEIAELLDDTWTVLVNETRPRVSAPPGTGHVNDVVLRARKET